IVGGGCGGAVITRGALGYPGAVARDDSTGVSADSASLASWKRALASRTVHRANHGSKPGGRRSARPYSRARWDGGSMGSTKTSRRIDARVTLSVLAERQ